MAYVPGQKIGEEEDPQQNAVAPNAPALGSTPSVGGTVAGASPVAQSNASQGGAGTGFVNIDRYLGANQGAANDVKKRQDAVLSKEGEAFDKATLAPRSALFEAHKTQQAQQQNTPQDYVNGVMGATSDELRNAAVKTAQDAVNARYKGPTTVDYNIGNTADAKRAAALGNAASAGQQIATDNGTLAGYGTGLSAIDRAIYGSAQEAPTMQNAAAAATGQIANQQQQKAAIEQEAKDRGAAIEKGANSVRDAFGATAGQITKQADIAAKVAAAQNEFAKGNVVPTAAGRATWENGTGDPTAANFINGSTANQLSAIGNVLGDPTLMGTQAAAPYVPGHYDYHNPAPQTFGGDTVKNGVPEAKIPFQTPTVDMVNPDTTKAIQAQQAVNAQRIAEQGNNTGASVAATMKRAAELMKKGKQSHGM